MVDLLEEIKDDIHQERWVNLWKIYQNHIYTTIVVIVLSTSGFVYYQNHQKQVMVKMSENYMHALMLVETNPDAALHRFEEIPALGENVYSDLARLWAAALLLEKYDEKAASDIYETIVQKSKGLVKRIAGTTLFHDMALLKSFYLQIDTQDSDALLSKLKPYLSDTNPWKYSAYEIAGLLKMKLKDYKGAVAYFEWLCQEKDTPVSLKFRSQALLNFLKSSGNV